MQKLFRVNAKPTHTLTYTHTLDGQKGGKQIHTHAYTRTHSHTHTPAEEALVLLAEQVLLPEEDHLNVLKASVDQLWNIGT